MVEKQSKNLLHEAGGKLLQELAVSGHELVNSKSYYIFLLYSEVNRGINEKLEETSGSEHNTGKILFKKIEAFSRYQFDIKKFSDIIEYDRTQEELCGGDKKKLGKLYRQRDQYIFGEWWKEKDDTTRIGTKKCTTRLVVRLALQLTDLLLNISEKHNVPYQSITKIFHNLLCKSENETLDYFELSQAEPISSVIANKIVSEIVQAIDEITAVISMSMVFEYTIIQSLDSVTRKRLFLQACSSYQFVGGKITSFSDEELYEFVTDEYRAVVPIWFMFMCFTRYYVKSEVQAWIGSQDNSDEFAGHAFLAEFKVIDLFIQKLNNFNYKMSGNTVNLLKYIIVTIKNLASKYIDKEKKKGKVAIFEKNLGTLSEIDGATFLNQKHIAFGDVVTKASPKTLQRMLEEGEDIFTDQTKDTAFPEYDWSKIDSILNHNASKQRHEIEKYYTQNKFIENVLMNSAWLRKFSKRGIEVPERKESYFKGKLRELIRSNKIQILDEGNAYYYKKNNDELYFHIAKELSLLVTIK